MGAGQAAPGRLEGMSVTVTCDDRHTFSYNMALAPVVDFAVQPHTHYRSVLQIFYDATQFVSRKGSPTLFQVIPAMDYLDKTLTNHSLNETLKPAIRAACALGKKTLNRYYSKTDESEMYRMAMSMYFITLLNTSLLTIHSQFYTRSISLNTSRKRSGSPIGSRPRRRSSWSSGRPNGPSYHLTARTVLLPRSRL